MTRLHELSKQRLLIVNEMCKELVNVIETVKESKHLFTLAEYATDHDLYHYSDVRKALAKKGVELDAAVSLGEYDVDRIHLCVDSACWYNPANGYPVGEWISSDE